MANGVGLEEIENARTALILKHNQEILYSYLDTHKAILQSREQLALKEAEIAMRSATTAQEFGNAIWLSMSAGGQGFILEYENIAEQMANITKSSLETITSSLTDMAELLVSDIENKSEKYKEVMRNMLNSIGKMLFEYGLKLMAIKALMSIFGVVAGASSAPSVASGTAPGPASMYPPNSLNLAPPGFINTQTGGPIRGGKPGKDSVPLMAMPGEYMIPKDSVDYYGLELMERLRKKELIKMAKGGLVEESRVTAKNSTSSVGNGNGNATVYKEGNVTNNFTIQTNDVNSFRQYLYENRQFITGMVSEESMNARGR